MKKKMIAMISTSALAVAAIVGGPVTFAAPKLEVTTKLAINQNQIAKQIDQFLQSEQFNGTILVAKDGKIVHAKGYGQANFKTKTLNNKETIFRIGSVSKSFTAVAIMQLAEQGKLKLDDPISKFIPDFPSGDKITIHHLLSHTSGLGDYLNEELLTDPIKTAKYVSLEEIVQQAANEKLLFDPGSKFSYSNTGYALLGYIVERVSHTTWDNYVNEYFFKPLGMFHSGVDINNPVLPNHAVGSGWTLEEVDMSYFGPAGGLYSTVGDLYKFDQALLSGKIVSQQTLDKMFTPVLSNYGYGWGDGKALKLSSDWKWHNGHIPGFFSYNGVNQKENMHVVMLTNKEMNDMDWMMMANQVTKLLESDQPKKEFSNLTPVKWLEKNSHALKTSEPKSSLKDLEPLRGMIGSAPIVGLGEAAHGMHEVFQMKHRIVEFMVTEMGFTNLVLEEDWGKALQLDHYVLAGEGNPSQILTSTINTKEMTDMLKWIRDYNADPKHEKKVRVIGMDMKGVSENVYDKITDYVKQHQPDLLPRLNEKMKDLIPVTKDFLVFDKLPKEEKERYISDAKQISAILEQHKNELKGDSKEFAWIQQNARIIEQFTTSTAVFSTNPPDFYLKHDIAMYENAKWTEENLGKTIVWGHNGHISKTNMIPFVYPKVAGQHLAEHYGDRYVSIGTSVFEGQYNVNNMSGEFGPHGEVKSDNPNSYNYTLGQVKDDQFFVDLRKASGSTKTWLDEVHPIFAGITTVGPEIPTAVDIPLGKTFDILIQIQKVTPSQLNR